VGGVLCHLEPGGFPGGGWSSGDLNGLLFAPTGFAGGADDD